MEAQALMALQEAAESFLCGLFGDTYQFCLHGRRVTIMDRDLKLSCKIRGCSSGSKEFASGGDKKEPGAESSSPPPVATAPPEPAPTETETPTTQMTETAPTAETLPAPIFNS
ncbi:unnamed protein product [Durusdinium trenchii]